MQFDLFHSLGRVDSVLPLQNDREVFRAFFEQVQYAEDLGFNTVWVAESHFSSEVQKSNPDAVIPHYQGELGLNCDFGQLAQLIFQKTRKINFGTAIHNIVGGNGGPLSSANRVRSLVFYNAMSDSPRDLHIGVASGRFPYINKPFGIVPRDHHEELLWAQYKRIIFLEAYEIFYRLLRGEVLSSKETRDYVIDSSLFTDEQQFVLATAELSPEALNYKKRWIFDPLKLVPTVEEGWDHHLKIVLGSHDPLARQLAFELGAPDIFNLSFTPPAALAEIHREMFEFCQGSERPWHRSRLPRTVLVFIDENESRAIARAEKSFDTYIDAMAGTVKMPPRKFLMERALIGTPERILDEIRNTEKNGFDPQDRLMIWVEFNQKDTGDIKRQMQLFSEKVMSQLS